ncbi:sugar ABC transporter ATP-binding protein [Radicibacter daui]|uniref:sugar ABC transporter ATP-binding protein n=1 Tax=Radicibacter daui TaxID=3064829 RepID=UPI004046A441
MAEPSPAALQGGLLLSGGLRPVQPGGVVLAARGVSKNFPAVRALVAVDFELKAGEIHALLGENGAGKSTLIKVMTGVYERDGGDVVLAGRIIHPAHAGEAQALGISTVYQEVNLIPTLSVAENLMLERQPGRFGFVNWRRLRADARQMLARMGLDIDVSRPLGGFSVAVQQLVAIARAIALNARVLILDEPTASLDREEIDLLFAVMRDLRAAGLGIIFVTHFLDQVYEITDRITVLRNGQLIGTYETAELSQIDLVHHMLGRQLESASHRRKRPATGAPAADLVSVRGLGRRRLMEPLDLEVRAGELVGLAGLLGSGRTETAKLIFGAENADCGEVRVAGAAVDTSSPRRAIRAGFGFCPEDRKVEGIVPELSVRENIILALQARQGWHRPIPRAEQQRLADQMIEALGIATPDSEKPVGQLSGGNQQKCILARWLVSSPRFLILDEPTRGIDVGGHADIITLLRQLCDEGMGLLVASSELEEIVAVADRVAVLRDRRKVAELSGEAVTRAGIIEAIAQ